MTFPGQTRGSGRAGVFFCGTVPMGQREANGATLGNRVKRTIDGAPVRSEAPPPTAMNRVSSSYAAP